MSWTRKLISAVALTAALATSAGTAPAEAHRRDRVTVTELATFVDGPCADDICSSGSTVGPDGALDVADATAGRIQRVDPRRGTVTTFGD